MGKCGEAYGAGLPSRAPGDEVLGEEYGPVTEEVADAFAGSPSRGPDEPPPLPPTSLSEDETDEDGEGEDEESTRKDLPRIPSRGLLQGGVGNSEIPPEARKGQEEGA